jgi:hypothetical protein
MGEVGLDAVAGAVAHFQRVMMMDVEQAAKAMKGRRDRGRPRRLQSAHLQRHAGQWGPSGYLVIPARWFENGRPDAQWVH